MPKFYDRQRIASIELDDGPFTVETGRTGTRPVWRRLTAKDLQSSWSDEVRAAGGYWGAEPDPDAPVQFNVYMYHSCDEWMVAEASDFPTARRDLVQFIDQAQQALVVLDGMAGTL